MITASHFGFRARLTGDLNFGLLVNVLRSRLSACWVELQGPFGGSVAG